MKLLSKLATGILAAVVVAGSMPTTAHALYNNNNIQYNNGFTLLGFNDATAGPAQGFWVLDKAAPKYNLLYGAMGTWVIAPVLRKDGSLCLMWSNATQITYQNIDSTGKLTSSATYANTLPIAGIFGPIGTSNLQLFNAPNGGLFGWLVGSAGNIIGAPFAWGPTTAATLIATDERSETFNVTYALNPVAGPPQVAGQLTVWEFNNKGVWTAARTYAY